MTSYVIKNMALKIKPNTYNIKTRAHNKSTLRLTKQINSYNQINCRFSDDFRGNQKLINSFKFA